MWLFCLPVVQEAGFDGLLGTLDSGIHAHVAIEVRVGTVAAPAGGDQLGPDSEGAAWEALAQCEPDVVGTFIDFAPVFVVVGLDVDERIIDDVARVDGRVCTELDASWGERTHRAVEAGRDDLPASDEQLAGLDCDLVVSGLDEWHCHSFQVRSFWHFQIEWRKYNIILINSKLKSC